MNCETFATLLDDYMDGRLSQEDAAALEAHARQCPRCQDMLTLRQDMRALAQDGSVPADLSLVWRQRIREEMPMKHKNHALRSLLSAAAVLVFLVGGTFLSRDHLTQTAPQATGVGDRMLSRSVSHDAGVEYSVNTSAKKAVTEQQPEKIIRTASFTLSTQTLDAVQQAITDSAVAAGGRVESLSVYGEGQRTAYLTLRIPEDQLDAFLTTAKSAATVTAFSESSRDVSDSYYDLESRLDAQRQKMDRLLALMNQATTVSDLVEIETAIADTQYQIDNYTGQLNDYDSRILYSQVDVTVNEVTPEEDADAPFGDKVAAALQNSLAYGMDFLQDMALFILAVLPWLIPVAVLITIFFLIRRKGRKA